MKEWTRDERYRVLRDPEELRPKHALIRTSPYRQTYHVQPVTGLSSDPNGFALHRGMRQRWTAPLQPGAPAQMAAESTITATTAFWEALTALQTIWNIRHRGRSGTRRPSPAIPTQTAPVLSCLCLRTDTVRLMSICRETERTCGGTPTASGKTPTEASSACRRTAQIISPTAIFSPNTWASAATGTQ